MPRTLILKTFQYSIDIWWKIYCSRLYSGSDGGLSSLLSDGDVESFLDSFHQAAIWLYSNLILKTFQYFIDTWWKIYCSRLYSGSDGGLSSLLSDGDVATFLASCCDMHVSLSRALYKLEFSRCRHSHMGMASSTDG